MDQSWADKAILGPWPCLTLRAGSSRSLRADASGTGWGWGWGVGAVELQIFPDILYSGYCQDTLCPAGPSSLSSNSFGTFQAPGTGMFARLGSTKQSSSPHLRSYHLLPPQGSAWEPALVHSFPVSGILHTHTHTQGDIHTSMRSCLPAWILMVTSGGSHNRWEATDPISGSKSVNRSPDNNRRLSFPTMLAVGG